MDRPLNVWPEEPESRSQAAELLLTIDRELADDLCTTGESSEWSKMIAEVFGEGE